MDRMESMPLNPEQARSTIIKRAKQLVYDVIAERGHDNPPFSPADYGKILGVREIVQQDFGKSKLSGMLLKFHDHYVIKLNKNQNLARQNFSCAHELGHILFTELQLGFYTQTIEYRTFNPSARNKARADARERLCDAAATELLMPEAIFKKHLSNSDVSISTITQIADTFDVSVQAAAKRTSELSSEPCMVIVWEFMPTSKEIRYKWSSGPGVRDQRQALFMPVNKNIPCPSILHDAYKQDDCTESVRHFKRGNVTVRLPMVSKAFGRGDSRYVLSLVTLGDKYREENPHILGGFVDERG